MRKLTFLLLLVSFASIGQKKNRRDTSAVILQPDRIEFELSRPDSEFYVISGGRDGIMVIEDADVPSSGGNTQWKVTVLDTALEVHWRQTLILPSNADLLGYEYFQGNFHLLFTKGRFRGEELIVYQFTSDEIDFVAYELTTVFPLDISHFEVVGETILLAGHANFRPVIVTYDIYEQKPKVLPGFYDNRNDILDVIVDHDSQLFSVVLSERMRNKRTTVRVKTFTSKGDLIQDNLIDPGDRRSLIDAASTSFSGGLQYLAGTQSRKSTKYSQGFYLSKFINGQQQFNKYYPFADLNNFFGHLKPGRERRIKKRIDRKRQRGKTKRFNYRLLVHEIIERDGEYMMIAEAYYPRYNRSAGNTAFRPSNQFGNFNTFGPSAQDPFFIGNKYTHAVVVGFDANCNIIWDQTFKIEDTQSYSLEENVVVCPEGDRVVLMYVEENEIRSKVVEGNEVLEGRTFSPVRLSFESDQLKSRDPNVEGLERWYDQTLFAYGEQSIKNPNGVDGKIIRKVFYINKIQYDLDRELN